MEKIDIRKESILWLLLLIPLIYIIYIWGELPERIAIHFNLQGEPNGWGGKWSILTIPFMTIGVYLLALFLPTIDPKRMENADFASNFYNLRVTIVIFMCAICIVAAQSAVSGSLGKTVARFIPFGTFLLFAVLGNFMINIKPNWFIGVRTPWTLSSDAVWRRTHQVVGRMWFYGGLLCALICFFIPAIGLKYLVLVFALGSALFAFVYSFWLYKKEKEGNVA